MAATISQVARERKSQLKLLMTASRRLDAKQERLEREVKRLINRKQSVPELADADRLIVMTKETEAELSNMVKVIEQVSQAWGMQYA